MNLYIHFGIYKAGSSYLQYICSNKREELQSKGIWFPHSRDEVKMNSGSISAGNAFDLGLWLQTNDRSRIEQYFLQKKEEAKSRRCDAILLSAESLIHHFAIRERLELLSVILKTFGYNQVYALGYFRDLVDHCLSLYKHRSKSGHNPDFEGWIKEKYETPIVLNKFFGCFYMVDFQWTFKQFKKDSNYMVKTFFDDWLNVSLSSIPEKTRVNESLTLSEVIVMQQFRPKFPNTFDYLLNILKSMPRISKASDKELERFYKSRAGAVLSNTQSSNLEIWNQHLSTKDQLVIEESALDGFDSTATKVYLSDRQIGSLIEATIYLTGMKSLGFRTRRFFKNILPAAFLLALVKSRK